MVNQIENLPVKIIKSLDTYDLHIMWAVHNKCNYKCSYCPPILNSGSYSWIKLEHLKGFIDNIESHYVKKLGYKNILFSFTGGEPTLWPKFREFLTYINSRGFRIGLTTNGSVAVKYWESIGHYFDYICLSFHPESAEIENFIKTFEYLHNAKETVIPAVRVMMHPEQKYWDKSIDLIQRLKKFPNWTYECVHILDDYGMQSNKISYDQKEKEKFIEENSFKSQFTKNEYVHVPKVGFNYEVKYQDGSKEKLDENKLINKNLHNFKNWKCFIGVEQLFIQHDGIVKRAGCNVGAVLGNISEYEGIEFPIDPVICTRSNCSCPTDIRISKFAPSEKVEINYKVEKAEVVKIKAGETEFQFKIYLEADKISFDLKEKVTKLVQNIIDHKKIDKEKLLIFAGRIDVDEVSFEFCKELYLQEIRPYLSFEINYKFNEELGLIKEFLVMSDSLVVNINNDELIRDIPGLFSRAQNSEKYNLIINLYLEDIQNITKVWKIMMLLPNHKIDLRIFGVEEKKNSYPVNLKEYIYYNEDYKFLHFHKKIIKSRNVLKVRVSKFLEDENVEMSSGEIKKMSNYQEELKTFKGWNCYKGNNNLYVISNGDIFDSRCSQKRKIGNISNFNPSKNLHIEAEVCKSETCINFSDRSIEKRKV